VTRKGDKASKKTGIFHANDYGIEHVLRNHLPDFELRRDACYGIYIENGWQGAAFGFLEKQRSPFLSSSGHKDRNRGNPDASDSQKAFAQSASIVLGNQTLFSAGSTDPKRLVDGQSGRMILPISRSRRALAPL
jgi:hypothetical protein